MSKINEFLTELEQELIYLKPKDAGDVLKFYRDKINIAMDYEADEDKIIASFENILNEIQINKNDFVIVLTRGHSFDYIVLKQVLKSNLSFVLMILPLNP